MIRYYVLLTASISSFALGITAAGAHPSSIYNDMCRNEIEAFQGASNAQDITNFRHALLLCLADQAYFDKNWEPSGHTDWSDSMHFQVFAKETEVKIGGTHEVLPVAAGAAGSAGSRIKCPTLVTSRSPGDPTDPLKSEGFDVFMSVDLGDMLAGGSGSFDQVQAALDHMRTQSGMPFLIEQQAANVVAQMSEFNADDLGRIYAPNAIEIADPAPLFKDVGLASSATLKAAHAAEANLADCGYSQLAIPITRTSGNGVPSQKYEGPEIYFHTNNIQALTRYMAIGAIEE